MVIGRRRYAVRTWLETLVAVVAISITGLEAQTRNASNQWIFPAEGTRVPVAPGDPCVIVVQAIEPGSWWNQNPPEGQTKARPGRAIDTEQSRQDVRNVVTLLERTLAGSEDMRRKTRGFCERLGVTHIVIYVVRNDPNTRGTPAAYINNTNLVFVDVAAVASKVETLTTPGNGPADQQAASRTRVGNAFLGTLIPHELHHGWTGDRDPGEYDVKGGAVNDENQVASEMGMTNYERLAYMRRDGDGLVYVPYLADGVEVRMPLGRTRAQKPPAPTGTRSNYCCELDDEDHDLIERVDELDASANRSTQGATDGWQLSVFGGFTTIGNSPGGIATATPAGQPFTAANGLSSVIHPSWLTQAGAALLQGILEAKGIEPTTEAIDAILGGNTVAFGSGVLLGALLSRPMSETLSLWVEFRMSTPSYSVTEATRALAEIRHARLATDIAALLEGTPDAFVDTTLTVQSGGGQNITIGGGLEYSFMGQQFGGWHPSVRGGVGFTWHAGDQPGMTLVTDYGFPLGGVSFRETDTLVIAADTYRSFGVQFGGAVSRPLSSRMNLVIDVMFDAYKNGTEIEVSATPTRDESGASASAQFPVDPTVQFGQGTATSSLSGRLDGFTVFEGSGWRVSPRFTIGIEFDF